MTGWQSVELSNILFGAFPVVKHDIQASQLFLLIALMMVHVFVSNHPVKRDPSYKKQLLRLFNTFLNAFRMQSCFFKSLISCILSHMYYGWIPLLSVTDTLEKFSWKSFTFRVSFSNEKPPVSKTCSQTAKWNFKVGKSSSWPLNVWLKRRCPAVTLRWNFWPLYALLCAAGCSDLSL